MDWKPEYAKSIQVGPYHADDLSFRPMFHHVNPHVVGRALCNSSVHLDMSTMRDDVPADHSYCLNCKRIQINLGAL